MVDLTIRKNEKCVLGLPRCDFVFNSTRTCFLAYGFQTSSLETEIIRNILRDRQIELIEAGGHLEPAPLAICTKICSKIITAQFCIVIANNDIKDGVEVPNANVNMEYGLILGHNKYVVPFQREEQTLPFNVAGLDTVKYTDRNFRRKAEESIDAAIEATTLKSSKSLDVGQILETFLLTKQATLCDLTAQAEKDLYSLGKPCGFNLLISFDGLKYIYFGDFTSDRPEFASWRIKKLQEILDERLSPEKIAQKIKLGAATHEQAVAVEFLRNGMEAWVVAAGGDQREAIKKMVGKGFASVPLQFFTLDEVFSVVDNLRVAGT